MFKKQHTRIWPGIIIIAVIFLFHIRLFFPQLSIYITPDYGRSDAWHLSIADKFYYAQALKKGGIPTWNPQIGNGYPILAEGQTGSFFLPNLIFFKFLPFVLAYNISIISAFFIAGMGTYFFARSLGFNKFGSVYAGLIFSLGGFFVVHVQHLHLIQTASMLPWAFWATAEYFGKKSVKYLVILSILVAEQIFAGFPQLVFYSLFALYIYVFVKIFYFKESNIKTLIMVTIFLAIGVGLSAIQLLPTYELFKFSARESSAANVLNEFPYTSKNLLQFINPFILGTPKDGSYPAWVPGKWGIYWESIAYVGILPLIFAALSSILWYRKKGKHRKTILIFFLLTTIGVLLSLGKSSPLHPVFSFPLFSTFRVPSRFLLITQFGLCILAGLFITRLNKKLLIIPLMAISTLNLFYYFFYYNPVDAAHKWFQPTQTATFVKNNDLDKIFSTGQSAPWTKYFLKKGWENTSYYYDARNSLDQNSNLIFGIRQFFAYESLLPQRMAVFIQMVNSGITTKDYKISIATNSANILRASGVSAIITPNKLDDDNFKKIFQSNNQGTLEFNVYKNKNKTNRVFIVSDYKIANTIPQMASIFENESFDPLKNSLLESDPKINTENRAKNSSTSVIEDKDSELTIQASLDGEGILVLADSFYPGWKAYENGSEISVYPANINQKAVSLKNGVHKITFKYQPNSLRNGALVSLLFGILTVVIIIKIKPTQ